MKIVILLVILLVVGICASESFLSTHLDVMKKLLHARHGEENGTSILDKLHKIEHKIEDLVIDAKAIKFLFDLHDEDQHCNELCEGYIAKKFFKSGHSFMNWKAFEDIITKIYGDAITDDPYEPQELHLALTNSIDTMNIMFVTMQELAEPFVEVTLGDNTWTSAAITSTYRVPQKWWPIFTGTIYSANMEELEPDTTYTYRVGGQVPDNSGTMKYSDVFTFKTAPIPSPDRQTVVATMADHGTFELFGWKTVEVMKSKQEELSLDFVHVSGDLSYAGLSTEMKYLHVDKEDEFEHIWDLLFIQNQPVAAEVPWMVTNGNHERFYDWAAYKARFTMPTNNDLQSNGNFWYTYEYGNSRWISISSEHDLSEGSPQMKFLTQALDQAVDRRSTVPWIVVSIHKPMYCSAKGTPGGFADALEATMIKYDVDLYISGHLHCYERVHPVEKGQVTTWPERAADGTDLYRSTGKGPVQIVQGNAGGMQAEKWNQPQPEWSAVRFANGYIPKNSTEKAKVSVHGLIDDIKFIKDYDYEDTYGFGVATFVNATHLYYQNIPVEHEAHGPGYDSFWVVKRV
jgi:acid phosphatase type 7